MAMQPDIDVPGTPEEVDQLLVQQCGFYEFVDQAWNQIDRAEFVPNWHIKEICGFLEEVAYDRYHGKGREFCICVPPASTKSRTASVMWQPWIWTWWPEATFLSCTFEGGPGSIALKLGRLSRDLVLSKWYQRRWPMRLVKSGESFHANEFGGVRESVGTGMAVTGDHYHFHLGDDLVKEQLAREGTPAMIAKNLEKANGYWFGTVATREKELGKTARGIIGQRLHRDDPPGECERRGYEMVVFPAHFKSIKADPRDYRTKDGELLCPARANEEYYQKKAEELGPAAAAAQLEQDPVPPGGQIIEEEYFSHRYDRLPSKLQRAFESQKSGPGQVWRIYGDMTFKGKTSSDWVVLQLWASFQNEYFLIDQIRGQWGFEKSKQKIIEFCSRHTIAESVKLEDAANAPALEDSLKTTCPIPVLLAPMDGGCLARTQNVEGIWASARVRLPTNAHWLGGGDGFIAEHLAFDGLGTRHDDQVACSSLALVDLAIKTKNKWKEWGNIKR